MIMKKTFAVMLTSAMGVVASFGGVSVAWSKNKSDQLVTGKYFARVADATPEMAPLQTFDVTYRVRKDSNGAVQRIRYELPQEVVGVKNEIHISADPSAPGGFVSQDADTVCTVDANSQETQCKLVYKDLKIDAVAVESFVRATYSDPAEQEARLSIARAWSAEPIGFLTIPGAR